MSVDLTHAVKFDLPRGSVHGAGQERAVLLPASAFADLVMAAGPEVTFAVAQTMGASIGRRMASRFGGVEAVAGQPIEEVVTALATEISLAGLGALSLERWGQALVLVVHHAPPLDRGFLPALLEGAIKSSTGVSAHCTLLSPEGALRILVGSQPTIDRVRAWLAEGTRWGDALVRLQEHRP